VVLVLAGSKVIIQTSVRLGVPTHREQTRSIRSC